MITSEQLASITLRPQKTLEQWVTPLTHVMEQYDITTTRRKEMFLAQIALESTGFSRVEENLNYSSRRLREVFPKYFLNDAMALRYAGKPEQIANRVYARRSLGNGNEASGDGWKYRGRGLKQLTGKYNYEQCGKGLAIDLVHNPDMLTVPEYAALSAGWFWESINGNSYADTNNFKMLTKRINGGLNGYKDRCILLGRAEKVRL